MTNLRKKNFDFRSKLTDMEDKNKAKEKEKIEAKK